MSVPAPLLRRYAAWSLDAAAVGVVTLLVLAGRLPAALDACRRALDRVSRAMAESMVAGLDAGASPLALLQGGLGDPALQGAVLALAAASTALLVPVVLVFGLASLAWFTAFEGSRWQATPGKRLLALQVIDDDGLAPGYARAALRHAGGLLSWLSLNIGHAMAGLAPRYQALHDRIAGTRVVQMRTRPMPPAVRLWLALQVPAGVAAVAWLLRVVDASVNAALEAALLG